MSATNNDNRFDLDLAFANKQEGEVLEMFNNSKIEVKSERGRWTQSGNIAIEYFCRGKPSGINVTEADYWFHNLTVYGETLCTLVFPVDKLKQILPLMECKSVNAGDKDGGTVGVAKCHLLNISKLFSTTNLKKLRASIFNR